MATKTRELSWSLSKAHLFQECPRRFYYQYYYSKAGYAFDAPDEARLALEMSRVKSLDMWAGEIVHASIQWALEQSKAGAMLDPSDIRAEAKRRLSEGWRASLQQAWRTRQDDENPNLFEHYYKYPVGTAQIDRIKDKVYTSITNFVDSDIYRTILTTTTARWMPIDKYTSFRLDGRLFYVKLDFALKNQNSIIVYDWKTGKPNDQERRQLACYAMYAVAQWNVPIEGIMVCAAHLYPELQADENPVDEEAVEEARLFAGQSFSAMLKCLRDPSRNIAAMDDFPMTGNLNRCLKCHFKGICSQAKMAAGDIDDLPVADDWDG